MAPSRMKLRVRRQDNAPSANALPQSDEEEEEQHQRRRQDRRRGASTRSKSRRKNNSRANSNRTDASTNTSTAGAGVPPAAAAAPPPSSSAAASRPVVSAEEASPDSKCPICLDRFNNLAYLDRCLHRFCFMCIQEWSHNKAECPLCKQPFASILHTVRGENDFKKYTLRRSPENGSVAATVAMVAAMASDHRMRLTLRSSSNRQRRNQRMVPVWEWLVDSPPDSPEYIPISPPVNAQEPQPLDFSQRGIIFEGLTGLGPLGNLPPFVANNRETRKLLSRLAARRRLQREGGRVRALRDREAVALRRGLYRCGIRVRGIAGSNQDQAQREISVESFCHNPSNLNRLRPWIRRELAVLYGSHDSLIAIVQRIIMARVARHGLEDLPVVEDELRPFLLARTDHFLHELVSFARSPLAMESYDAQAVYEPPDVAFNVDALDSSTDSCEVIAISEEEEERERGGAVEPVQESQASLSMTGWDDETPGPSYSTADSSCYLSSFSPALHEAAGRDRGEALPQKPASPRQRGEDEWEEECLIVGYKKPIAERTPELVQLSSDSEDEKKKKKEGKDDGGEKDEKEKEGKEEDQEATEKQLQPFLPALSPSPCREEIVDDAQPSRSHSDSPNPGHSLTEVLLRVLGEERCKSKRRKRDMSRSKRLRCGGDDGGTPPHLNSSPFSSSCGRFSRSPSHQSSSDSFRGYSIVSPLNSSCPSTPKSSSSSLFGSSPPMTPPPRDKCQNVEAEEEDAAAAVAEKPGGKRKYKSRHLDSHVRDPTWRPSGGKGSVCESKSKAKEVERIRKEEREKRRRGRRRERRKRAREERRGRDERSPSVEIVFEGTVSSLAPKRRRLRDCLLSSPPLVITLDSDSDRGPLLDCSSSSCSACNSPFGSQQTVNFCHFPTLPLVHSSGAGGALEGSDIGELPADILDRGSEKSDAENRRNESAALISLENSSDSDTDIDVEMVDANKTPNCRAGEMKEEPQGSEQSEGKAAFSKSGNGFQERSETPNKASADDADQRLLDSILSVLDGIAAKPDRPSTSSPGFPQSNHVKNNTQPESQGADRFLLPPFQQLAESRAKFPPAEKSHGAAKRTEEIANEFRTMHTLETHHEIANSLLALRDPENGLATNNSTPNPAEIGSGRSSPNSDSLLAALSEKTDLAREKACGRSRGDLDIRKYNSTNAEDVK
ncbi:uncharacterized protein [Eucyclogobius newberryi]|uniref:uncharacterized protein n=1 Tax=Eucyclogobius newberryi TaxID=166745 RepID=UPI003B5A0D16